jgi:serine/threonine protein kinase
MEYCPGGDLLALLRSLPQGTFLPDSEAFSWIVSLARAVQSIHSKGFYHRDIKPPNVFIDEQGVAKLGDFGVSVKSAKRDQAVAGTRHFIAPECIHQGVFTAKSDSFVVCLFFFFCAVLGVFVGLWVFQDAQNGTFFTVFD